MYLLQVLNGLLSRENQKEGISIPIGIIPAGSDNSLVWTVLGVRDPISAAMAIVKVTPFANISSEFATFSFRNYCFAYHLSVMLKSE